MYWTYKNGKATKFKWLCAYCTEDLFKFTPDMGDEVKWHPGKCERCKNKRTVFTPEEI